MSENTREATTAQQRAETGTVVPGSTTNPDAGTATVDGDRRRPIVVGFDGSDSARAALAWAARQGSLTGSPVELFATWSMPKNYGYAIALEPNLDLAADTEKALDAAIAEVREGFPNVDFQRKVVEGEPRSALVARAKIAEMLVLGSRGHGELTGMLLGSVSGYCVTHATCPVLVVRR